VLKNTIAQYVVIVNRKNSLENKKITKNDMQIVCPNVGEKKLHCKNNEMSGG